MQIVDLVLNILSMQGQSQPLFGRKRMKRGRMQLRACMTKCAESTYGGKDHPDGKCATHKRNGGCRLNDFWKKRGYPLHKRCPVTCKREVMRLSATVCHAKCYRCSTKCQATFGQGDKRSCKRFCAKRGGDTNLAPIKCEDQVPNMCKRVGDKVHVGGNEIDCNNLTYIPGVAAGWGVRCRKSCGTCRKLSEKGIPVGIDVEARLVRQEAEDMPVEDTTSDAKNADSWEANRKLMAAMFDAFDLDKNGVMGEKEVVESMRRLLKDAGHKATPAQVREAADRLEMYAMSRDEFMKPATKELFDRNLRAARKYADFRAARKEAQTTAATGPENTMTASYGSDPAEDDADTNNDVREVLFKRVFRVPMDPKQITVNNRTMGGDPWPGMHKQLIITIKQKGGGKTLNELRVQEGDTLDLIQFREMLVAAGIH